MKRSKTVNIMRTASFAAALVAAGALTACSEEEAPATHGAICVDPNTEVRVDDSKCDDDDTHYTWFYYPIGYHAPAVGSSVRGTPYVKTAPAGGVFSRVPSKGGFGGHMGTTGG